MKFRRSLQHVQVKRGAGAATDHHLIVAKVKLKLMIHQNIASTGKRFNIPMLAYKTKKSEVQIKNRSSTFQNAREEIVTIEEDHWQEIKEEFTTACETSLTRMKRTVQGKIKGPLKTNHQQNEEQMKRWVEHFNNVLNQDPPVNKADIPPSEELLAISCNRPFKGEIKKTIKMLENNNIQHTCKNSESRH
ncbi:unnamed protein product [Mytilus coruscus]|uniref:Uncharacterized protein n=1 Tax=Mytilus coruscus TaxID=42192 RepID=A0A6J8CH80_MYTCO|nr:unnamed protein product [Mytilus coruscus]